MDIHDIITATASSKFKGAGKLFVASYNSLADYSVADGSQTVFGDDQSETLLGGKKSGINVFLDFGGEVFKFGTGKVGELGGISGEQTNLTEALTDQVVGNYKDLNQTK